MILRRTFILFAFLLSLAFFESCKKGCTDAHAFNYSHAAKADDGSCLYCDSSFSDPQISPALYQYFFDMQPQSPHYNQNVGYIALVEKQLTYSGNACKHFGYTTDNTCDNYVFSPIFYNFTADNMTLNFTLSVNELNSGQFFQKNMSVTVPPNSTDSLPYIASMCIPHDITFFSFNMNVSNTVITYH